MTAVRPRPNTQLPAGGLQQDLILCCGEDLSELKQAIQSVFGRSRLRQIHAYRCYAFFAIGKLSFAWTGIGTGCIEPLLCEIVDEPRLRRIILVGTAGAVSDNARLGGATPIHEARIACAGIAPKRSALKPNWRLEPGIKTQTIVSTDYYYGFTLNPNWPARKLWAADTRLVKEAGEAAR